MGINWKNFLGFGVPECLPCCNDEPPLSCRCKYYIPYYAHELDPEDVYGDLAEAQDALATLVASCYGKRAADGGNVVYASFTADPSVPNEITLTGSGFISAGLLRGLDLGIAFTVPAGTVVTIDWEISVADGASSPRMRTSLVSCADDLDVDLQTGTIDVLTGTWTTPSLPAGQYVLRCIPRANGIGTLNGEFVISASTLILSPVVAVYDDSGTTRELEACPFAFLPPGTEETGDWYTDATAAADALTDQVSNCLAYIYNLVGAFDSFVASFGSGELTLTAAFSPPEPEVSMTASFNGEAGDIITVDATLDAADGVVDAATVSLYDYNGELIATGDVSDGTHAFAALPYTGKYYIDFVFSVTANTTAADVEFVLSSDGTLEINAPQALYDTETDVECPKRLDCS